MLLILPYNISLTIPYILTTQISEPLGVRTIDGRFEPLTERPFFFGGWGRGRSSYGGYGYGRGGGYGYGRRNPFSVLIINGSSGSSQFIFLRG